MPPKSKSRGCVAPVIYQCALFFSTRSKRHEWGGIRRRKVHKTFPSPTSPYQTIPSTSTVFMSSWEPLKNEPTWGGIRWRSGTQDLSSAYISIPAGGGIRRRKVRNDLSSAYISITSWGGIRRRKVRKTFSITYISIPSSREECMSSPIGVT